MRSLRSSNVGARNREAEGGQEAPPSTEKANATTTGSYSGVSWVAYSWNPKDDESLIPPKAFQAKWLDLSIALNTISRERRLAARREVYRLKVKMEWAFGGTG
ncbi:hypothetical protein R1sor_005886 [Riccia sorocarpa]|uniref:Uncharacterized protein n=1 Tax=Riccia sorocarpa TaxID=122646 RepID=A0ABD3HKU3_9MARC